MTCEIWNGRSELLVEKIEGPIDAIITDPPYGMAFESERIKSTQGKKFVKKIENDASLDEALAQFFATMLPLVPKTADDCDMYVFTRWDIVKTWIDAINELDDFTVQNLLVWDKMQLAMGDIWANWDYSFEFIIYAKKGRRLLSKRRSSILSFERVHQQHRIHPTEKPVALISELIKVSTKPGDLIVDPFAGSGSTIVAAEQLGRRAIGIELDPDHFRRGSARLGQNLLALDV